MEIPTIIVSRQVLPGKEREFERWNRRIRTAAERWPGHMGSEAQPPNEAHPDEWVIVYRFDTVEHLDAWMRSPERATLIEEGNELLAKPVREQRLAQSAPEAAVTAVMTQRVKPEAWREFRHRHAEITLEMRTFDGFVSCELIEPVPAMQDDHVVVFTFDTRSNLDRWLASETRRSVVAKLEPLIEGDRTLNVVGGFAGWFSTPGETSPKRWKQAVVVLLALFPTTWTLSSIQAEFFPDVPAIPALFVSNVIGIAVLTWLLMPPLTRFFDRWLRR